MHKVFFNHDEGHLMIDRHGVLQVVLVVCHLQLAIILQRIRTQTTS